MEGFQLRNFRHIRSIRKCCLNSPDHITGETPNQRVNHLLSQVLPYEIKILHWYTKFHLGSLGPSHLAEFMVPSYYNSEEDTCNYVFLVANCDIHLPLEMNVAYVYHFTIF